MHKQQKGFAALELILVLIVVVAVVIIGLFVFSKKNGKPITAIVNPFNSSEKDGPPPLQNIGFNLDYYNPATSKAGDFHFTQALAQVITGDPIYQNMIWADYGKQDHRSPNDPTKRNVQPVFILPLGTKVLAPIDGEVTKVETLYSGDYTIWFAKDSKATWSYETEHVINPQVKVGDKVKAGQVVAEVSTHGSQHHAGFGVLDLGLFHPENNEPTHHCPFKYLDESIKQETLAKITAFYKAWEDYIGKDVYDDAKYVMPGCEIVTPTKG
jgi:biotin carboxyl carrier protein